MDTTPATYSPHFAPLAAYLDAHPSIPSDGWQYMGTRDDGTHDYRRRERPDRGQARMYINLPDA